MGSEYQNVPDTVKSRPEEDRDVFDQFVNGDYKSLSRSNSVKPYDLELKELNKDNQVVRRFRTNSFNTNYPNSKKSPNISSANNSIILNDLKSSVKKLFSGSKQKLSPSSSIILNAKEKRKRNKRSISHSFSNQYEACLTSEEDDLDIEEEVYDNLSTTKPLLNRSTSKQDKKDSVIASFSSKSSDTNQKNPINRSTTTNSTESVYSHLMEQSDKMEIDENNNQDNKNLKDQNKDQNGELKRSESIRMRHNSNLNYPALVSNISSNDDIVQFKKSRKKTQLAKNYIAVFILFVVNLLNYVDRYTLAGMKKKFYHSR